MFGSVADPVGPGPQGSDVFVSLGDDRCGKPSKHPGEHRPEMEMIPWKFEA
jgi:hypothetical protein